jgi:hypothetical protein
MLPRAKVRGLVGCERDNGYIFKRWHPDTVQIPKPIPPSWSNLVGTFNISYYEGTEPKVPTEHKIDTEVLPPIIQRHEQHTTGRVETLPLSTTPQPAVKHAYAHDADIIETDLLKSEEAVEGVAKHALTEPQISLPIGMKESPQGQMKVKPPSSANYDYESAAEVIAREEEKCMTSYNLGRLTGLAEGGVLRVGQLSSATSRDVASVSMHARAS